MRPAAIRPALLLLAVLVTGTMAALALPPAVPPPAVSADAPAQEFSAARAMAHLDELARAPRPVGSEAHRQARAYLLAELRDLGLEPQEQAATGIRVRGRTVRAASLVNVIARVPGRESTGAVMLVSHYDSVPNSPGAADAGYGITAILEAVRAVLSGPPLRNDLVVLFTDAEEVGLLGAQAFVDEHPWADGIGVVLNLEARGHTGPVQMFRTTPGNGGMIRMLAKAVPFPAAESLANEVFRRLPNDTDMTVFERAGLAGMDFANVHGLTHYHTPLDNLANADARTLQHHGGTLLALARGFGEADLGALDAPDRVYFSLPGVGLVHYPEAWAPWLALGAAVVVLGLVAWGRRRRWLSGRATAFGAAHLVVAAVVLAVLATLAWQLLSRWLPETGWFRHGAPYDSGRYLLGLGLLVLAAYAAWFAWLRHRLKPAELLLGALVPWALLCLASALWLPGASYLFLWPPLAGLLALAWLPVGARAGRWATALVLGVLAVPPIVLVLPLLEGVAAALTLERVALPVGLLVLLLGLLSAQLDTLLRALGPRLPAGIAVLGLVVLVGAIMAAVTDANRPKPNEVHYIADLDQGQARWYSSDPAPDDWTRLYLGPAPGRGALPDWAPPQFAGPAGMAWQQPAPLPRGDGPRVRLLAASEEAGMRALKIRLQAPQGTFSTVIDFPAQPEVVALRIDGRAVPIEEGGGLAQLVYFAVPAAGTEIELITGAAAPLELRLRANLPGLPPLEDGTMPVRPVTLMPAQGDMTRLQRTVRF